MAHVVFAVTVVSEALIIAALVVTVLVPSRRVWPPPGRKSWQYRYIWTLTTVSILGAGVLGFLDWDTFILAHWSRLVAGAVLLVGGLSFALWGMKTLGVHASLGLGGEFITHGPYRYSRNPEYVGDVAAITGYALMCNSDLTMVAGALGIACFLLMPLAEEPWLRERFGEGYDDYIARVPRFIGRARSDAVRRG